MATPRPRTSLEDVRLGQALLKHRLVPAARLLELTRTLEGTGGSLRAQLVETGLVGEATVRALLDGSYAPAAAAPAGTRPAAPRGANAPAPAPAASPPSAPPPRPAPEHGEAARTSAEPPRTPPSASTQIPPFATASPLSPPPEASALASDAALDALFDVPPATRAAAPPAPPSPTAPATRVATPPVVPAPTAPATPLARPPAVALAPSVPAAPAEPPATNAPARPSLPRGRTLSDMIDRLTDRGDAVVNAERACLADLTDLTEPPAADADAAPESAPEPVAPAPPLPSVPAMEEPSPEQRDALAADLDDRAESLAPPAPPAPEFLAASPAQPTAFEPFVVDEHFICRRPLHPNGAVESFEAQHTTDQHFGVLFRIDPRRDGGREASVLRARAAAVEEFKNPCAQGILGHGTTEGRFYWVEEWIDGTPLSDYLRAGPLPSKSAASILADVAEALDEAHAHGMAHEALELDAVVITPSGRPRLIGFCRPGRSAPAGSRRNGDDARVQGDLDAALRLLRQMLDGLGGRGRKLDADEPLDRALSQLYALAGSTAPGRRYDSAGRLARDLRTAIAGEGIHPPGSSTLWRWVASTARWFRFSWLLGLAVLGGVGGFFGQDQYRKWREIQAMEGVDLSVQAFESAMAPYLARGADLWNQGSLAHAQGHFPQAAQMLREAVHEYGLAIDQAPRTYLSQPAYLARARARLLLEDWVGGVADTEIAIPLVAKSVEAHYLRALHLLADLHGKLSWFQEGRGQRRRLELTRGVTLDTLRREALRSLDECARSLSPGDRLQGWGAAAVALQAYLQARPADALPLLREVCAQDPDHRVAHEALAYLLASSPGVDLDAALGAAGHLVRKTPDHVRAYALRAELYLMRDNPARAQEDIAEAIRRAPEEGWLHEIQAKVDFARGRTDRALQDLEHAQRLAPGSASGFRIRARVLLESGRLDEALDQFGKALAALPEPDADLLLDRGAILEELRRPAEAAAEYARATEVDPARPEAWVGRVRCELARGDLGMAATLLPQAQDLHSGAAGLALALGIVRHGQQDWRAAIRALDKALELTRSERGEGDGEAEGWHGMGEADARSHWAGLVRWPCPPAGILHVRALCHAASGAPDLAERDWNAALELERDFLPALLARCELALDAGRAQAALPDARRIVALVPRLPRALVLRARAHLGVGDLAAAKADLDAAVQAAPDEPDAQLQRGILHLARGNPDEALKDFDRVVQRFPQSARPWALRASAEAARLNGRRAREDFETALSLDPRLAEAHLGLARLHADAGRLGDARAVLDRALRALPEDVPLRVARADLHVKAGRFAEALQDYDAAVALRPGDAVLLTNRGVAHQSNGDAARAREDYTRALELAPEFVTAWLNRGMLSLAEHRLEDARKDLDRALELRPGFFEAWLARARVREEGGGLEEALADYGEAIRCRPGAATAFVSRALVLVRLGRDAEARADLERALRIDPTLSTAIAPELKEVLTPRR